MNTQTVDAYLDELLAPPVREAVAPGGAPEERSAAAVKPAGPAHPVAGDLPAPAHSPAKAASAPTASGPVASAEQDAPPAARATSNAPGNRWLRAALGKDRYAFELLRVQEVVRISPIIALRGTAAAMLGLMNLRGRVVPVFDLARWLGTGRVEPDEHARIIVVERDDELIGVLVSAVDDVVTLSREHIEPPLSGTDAGGMVGVARMGSLPTVLLDADVLFD